MSVREIIARHGILKLPAVYCRLHGWRRTAQGWPAQWYAAWCGGLGDEVEAALADFGQRNAPSGRD